MKNIKTITIHAITFDDDPNATSIRIMECEDEETRLHMKTGAVANYILGCLDQEFDMKEYE